RVVTLVANKSARKLLRVVGVVDAAAFGAGDRHCHREQSAKRLALAANPRRQRQRVQRPITLPADSVLDHVFQDMWRHNKASRRSMPAPTTAGMRYLSHLVLRVRCCSRYRTHRKLLFT